MTNALLKSANKNVLVQAETVQGFAEYISMLNNRELQALDRRPET